MCFTTRAMTVIRSRFSIPRVIESPRPARTWSDRALLLRLRDTSISFSRNDGPHEAHEPPRAHRRALTSPGEDDGEGFWQYAIQEVKDWKLQCTSNFKEWNRKRSCTQPSRGTWPSLRNASAELLACRVALKGPGQHRPDRRSFRGPYPACFAGRKEVNVGHKPHADERQTDAILRSTMHSSVPGAVCRTRFAACRVMWRTMSHKPKLSGQRPSRAADKTSN